ncbi:uncharacterized protein LOC126471453 isoform X2 [Schistocerca serialis cubense]|uniref:uncharacterized protein LOC126471453 isoform X2 n=1 Tax=Schistocerca serialis cubense TaxID=2023355 RepID=UPI00214F13AD|nr:uncharacterized protein LOC126471453 isoform X2 [Schistocerca serialis cubense]
MDPFTENWLLQLLINQAQRRSVLRDNLAGVLVPAGLTAGPRRRNSSVTSGAGGDAQPGSSGSVPVASDRRQTSRPVRRPPAANNVRVLSRHGASSQNSGRGRQAVDQQPRRLNGVAAPRNRILYSGRAPQWLQRSRLRHDDSANDILGEILLLGVGVLPDSRHNAGPSRVLHMLGVPGPSSIAVHVHQQLPGNASSSGNRSSGSGRPRIGTRIRTSQLPRRLREIMLSYRQGRQMSSVGSSGAVSGSRVQGQAGPSTSNAASGVRELGGGSPPQLHVRDPERPSVVAAGDGPGNSAVPVRDLPDPTPGPSGLQGRGEVSAEIREQLASLLSSGALPPAAVDFLSFAAAATAASVMHQLEATLEEVELEEEDEDDD